MIPHAYVYPQQTRATGDLLRRRNYLMCRRADLLAHNQNTNTQYNLPAFGMKIAHRILRVTAPASWRSTSLGLERPHRGSASLGLAIVDSFRPGFRRVR